MALPQTDAFTRSNSNDVGGSWTEVEPGLNTAWTIASNQLQFYYAAGRNGYIYQDDGVDNMYVQATYEGRAAGHGFSSGLFIRGAEGASGVNYIDGYGLVICRRNDWDVGANDILLVKMEDVNYYTDSTDPPTGCTVLDGYTSPAWGIGDTLKLTMTGTTIEGYYKGAKVVEATSQSSFSGNTRYGFVGFPDGSNYMLWDNFEADSTATAPTLSLPTSADITKTTATLGATVDSDGGDTITERGIVWALSANPTTSDTKVTTTGTTGLFTVAVTNLTRNKTIHYRGFATNSVGTSYTDDDSFSTKKGGGSIIVVEGGGGRSPSWAPGGIRPNMYGT